MRHALSSIAALIGALLASSAFAQGPLSGFVPQVEKNVPRGIPQLDANGNVPILHGGTGAATAAQARINLGLDVFGNYGLAGTCLLSTGTAAAWGACPGGGGGSTPGGLNGSLQVNLGGITFAGDGHLTYDFSSHILSADGLALGSALPLSSGGTGLASPFGTAANTFAQGNDSRIVGAEQTANRGQANGYAPLDGSSRLPFANLTQYLSAGTGAVAQPILSRMSQQLFAVDFGVVFDGATDNATALTNLINYALSLPHGATISMPCGIADTSAILPKINKSHVSIASECKFWGRPSFGGSFLNNYEFGTTIKYIGNATANPVLEIAPNDDPTNGIMLSGNNLEGINVDCNQLASICIRVKSLWYSTLNIGFNEPAANGTGIVFDTANLRTSNNVQYNAINISGLHTQAGANGVTVDGNGCVNGDCNTAPGDFSDNRIGQVNIVCEHGTAWRWGFSDHNYVGSLAVNRFDVNADCLATEFLGSKIASDPNGVKPSRYNVIHVAAGPVTQLTIARGEVSGYDFGSHDNIIEDFNFGNFPTIEPGSSLYYTWDRHVAVAHGSQYSNIGGNVSIVEQMQQWLWDNITAGAPNPLLSILSAGAATKHVNLLNGDLNVLPFADASSVAVSDSVTDSMGCVPAATTVLGKSGNKVTLSANLLQTGFTCLLQAVRTGKDTFTFHGSLNLTTNADITPTAWTLGFGTLGTDRTLHLNLGNLPSGDTAQLDLGGGQRVYVQGGLDIADTVSKWLTMPHNGEALALMGSVQAGIYSSDAAHRVQLQFSSGTNYEMQWDDDGVGTGGTLFGNHTSSYLYTLGQIGVGCKPTNAGQTGSGDVLELCGRTNDPVAPQSGAVRLYENSTTGTLRAEDSSGKVRDVALRTQLQGTGSSTSAIRLTTDGAAASAANCFNVATGDVRSFDLWLSITDQTTPANWAAYKLSGADLVRTGVVGTTAIDGTLIQSGGAGTGVANGLAATVAADTTNACLDVHFTPPGGNTDTYTAKAVIIGAEAP